MPFLETGPLQTWGALDRAGQADRLAPGLIFDAGPLGQPAWGVLQPGPSCQLLGEPVLPAFSSSFLRLQTSRVPRNSFLFSKYKPTWRY